jgi:hypothetical protein
MENKDNAYFNLPNHFKYTLEDHLEILAENYKEWARSFKVPYSPQREWEISQDIQDHTRVLIERYGFLNWDAVSEKVKEFEQSKASKAPDKDHRGDEIDIADDFS